MKRILSLVVGIVLQRLLVIKYESLYPKGAFGA